MRSRIIFIVMLLLSLAATSYAQDIESLTAPRPDGSKIHYYLFRLSEKGPIKTLLLILQGSDCNSVLHNNAIFSDYKNIWPKADLLLVEKYGIDKHLAHNPGAERKDYPKEYLKKDSPKQRVKDINSVLKTIRKENIYERIVLIGGSEGAVVANMLTAENNYIDATISFNGGGRWFIDDVIRSIALENKDSKETKEAIEGFRDFARHLLDREPFDIEMSGHGFQWWHQMLSIDQLAVLKKINAPLLIIQGGADLSVSPEKVDEMVSALRASGKKNVEYIRYENLDHRFNNAEDENKREEVVADMNAWLKTKLKTLREDQDQEEGTKTRSDEEESVGIWGHNSYFF